MGKILWLLCLLSLAGRADAAALTAWPALDPYVRNTVPASLEIFKGMGTDSLYPLEVDQTTGALPVEITGGSVANPAASPTGSPVPSDADYQGLNNGGTLIGAIGDSSGRAITVGAGTAGTPVGGVLSVQGVASGTAIPISAASLPLPTGASTSAKQPALGTAGTASSDVITVQGIASMTPLLVTQSGSGTQQPTNVAQFGGSNVVTGTGVSGAGIPRMTVSSDSSLSATNFPATVDVNSGVVGASTIREIPASHAVASNILANNSYAATNVTTSAYVQLIASTTNALNIVCMSNSSGSIIKVATGAAASEVDRFYVPGGGSLCYPLNIAASTRISLEALDATASTGYFLLTGML